MATKYVDSNATGGANDGTSWEDAYTDIEAAIAASSSGDALWVKTGTYYPESTLSIPEGVSVYGGFDFWLTGTNGSTGDRPWNTYIDGGGTIQGVLMQDGSLIDGFVVENCSAVDGAGIVVVGGSSGYYEGPELVVNGNMSSIASWSGSANATLSQKLSGGIVGYYLQIFVDDGYPNSATASQSILTSGHTYTVRGYLQGAGGSAQILHGATVLASVDGYWQFKSNTFTATGSSITLKSIAGEVDYNHFDEISVKELLSYPGAISATIRNCWVRNCAASGHGGGIFVSDATVTIENCTIHDCTAGGDGGGIAFTEANASVSVSGCEIRDCSAGGYGGGISFRGNDAGNEYVVLRCRIHDNEATLHGGGVYVGDNAGADIRFTRCVLYNNTAAHGDFYINTGVAIITGCTFYNAVVDYILQRNGGTLTVVNSIVWGLATPTSGTMTITYSDVQGGYAGTGNVNVDPKFRGGTGFHPYALDGLSDCVDSANAGAAYHTSTDILGKAMYDHPGHSNDGAGTPAYADIGAYEYQGAPDGAMDMALYFLNLGLATEITTAPFFMHTIIRLPEEPWVFGGNFAQPKNVRHLISSEIEVDEADSELSEFVFIDSGIAAHRAYDGTPILTPSRAADYHPDFQSDDDPQVAEDMRHREGDWSSKVYTGGNFFRHVTVSMQWNPLLTDGNDVMRIFNVDLQQIHNLEYDFSNAAVEAHGSNVLFAPDVPLSSYHMRLLLQETLLKILYEALVKMSVPVFGQFMIPVV